MKNMKIKNKVVVITGASKGLGLEMAKEFLAQNYFVVGCSRQASDFTKTEDIRFFPFEADVTDEQAMKILREKVVKQFGQIDIWINNAGVWIPHSPFEKITKMQLHAMISVNFLGTFIGCREAYAAMKKKKQGTIVNIISTSALEGRPFSSGYCASKFAQDGFTKSIQGELKDKNIKVLGVYPGAMQTALFGKKHPVGYSEFMDTNKVAKKIVKFVIDPKSDRLVIKKI